MMPETENVAQVAWSPSGSAAPAPIGRVTRGGGAAHRIAAGDAVPGHHEGVDRAINAVLALLALVLLSPVLLLVALAVRLDSPGPVIFRQTRVGLDRRWTREGRRSPEKFAGPEHFTIYKFRTMYVDATERGGDGWAQRGDPRTTRLGKLLRPTRLDELPQFANVLLGHMNIVGPRPERPHVYAALCREVPGFEVRKRVKPGITGLAQINQSYDTGIDDVRRKLVFDVEYVRRKSVVEDLRIMVRTVVVMAFRRGGW